MTGLEHVTLEVIPLADGAVARVERHGRWSYHVEVTIPDDDWPRAEGRPPRPVRPMPLTYSPGVSASTRRGAMRLVRKTWRHALEQQELRRLRDADRPIQLGTFP